MATTHYVTCYYCKERFNRDVEETVQISPRRYAHKACADKFHVEKTQEEKDLESLEYYIKQLFHTTYVSAKIRQQIRSFREEYNYTYSGILKSLIYWFDIKKNSLDDANYGIGIVPYIYQEAYDYYYNLHLVQEAVKRFGNFNYKPIKKEVSIPPPVRKTRKIKLFNLDE